MTNMSIFVSLQVFINSYCSMLFRFTSELRLASHANKSLNNKVFWSTLYLLFTGKRFLILDGRKVTLTYSVLQIFLQINQIPKKKKKKKKNKQDQKSLALISFSV